MNQVTHKKNYLKDYQPSVFLIDHVYLHFELNDDVTEVTCIGEYRQNPQVKSAQSLVLNGEAMTLKSINLDGKPLAPSAYRIEDDCLIIDAVPEKFTLETVVAIKPQDNTKLSGLYKSHDNYCTQCESHGFRRITYFLDRPDVLGHYTTTISADKDAYPVLLSNGNLVEKKQLTNNRHWVKWEDPSLKPCYLFALVAGKFEHIKDTFITRSKHKIDLYVYVEEGKLDQAQHAMGCIKRAMRWDEETFGREYDLDMFMIVGVNDFNFGAMENKGLNIFNTKYILANPKNATDTDFQNIEAVIGHEYFHNWSGNRVTCRDWFQITLKEGLTVFRDESFTADMHSYPVKRIDDVNIIRSVQFAEDASPMAHPIQPDSYIEVNNFYTATVYNKGAEVIRMMRTMLGQETFRQATDLYFARHDGQAVTTEEFVKAMEDASNMDLQQFRRWYHQAGTPVLDITDHYDADKKVYSLTVKQSCPATIGQPNKEPFYLPLAIGLVNQNGEDLLTQSNFETPSTQLLTISQPSETFTFNNITSKPVPSLGRNFSAPVKIHYDYQDKDLLMLLAHDSDPFNAWDAGQRIATKIILNLVSLQQKGSALKLDSELATAFAKLLDNNALDKSFVAKALVLPSESYLMECLKVVDVDAIHSAREFVRKTIATTLKQQLIAVYHANHGDNPYHWNTEQSGRRALKNIALAYLVATEDTAEIERAKQQFQHADNMTDIMAALVALNQIDNDSRTQALKQFYHDWHMDALVMDKWLMLHATASFPTTLNSVKELTQHKAFNIKNPNKVRSLIGVFASQNHVCFHEPSGKGYQFLADQVLKLNDINPQVGARIITPLIQWRKFDAKRQDLMKTELERVMQQPNLAKDIYEVVERSLRITDE